MKIALVAMSGIRVCDEELLNMGLTLPGFVERSKIIASLPSLGLLTLAGMTPPHFEVDYIEIEDFRDGNTSAAPAAGYDLVAISSYTAQIHEAYNLADYCRRDGARVVMGGLHVSALPDEAGKHCDSIVVGEGELSWLKLLEDLEKGSIKPAYGSRTGSFDLAEAPLPAFELLDIDRYNRLTIQTSRGCPHKCEFCASSTLLSDRYKQKPAEKILAEIDAILGVWEHPFIELADDNTFIDRRFWKELLPEIAKRKIRWFTETDISMADDPAMLTLARKAGCAQVLIGLESPTEDSLSGVETKSDWKRGRLKEYREAIDRIQSHGISVNGCFIIGLDGHGPEIFDQVYDFVRGSGLHEVQITIQTAFPGTPLYDRLVAEGRMLEPEGWEKCTLFDLNFRPSDMEESELREGFRELGARLYSDKFTTQRQKHFKKQLLKNRRN